MEILISYWFSDSTIFFLEIRLATPLVKAKNLYVKAL